MKTGFGLKTGFTVLIKGFSFKTGKHITKMKLYPM
jgi:hypothetical protein